MSDLQPKLTGKQSRFVDEYLVDLNATQAAIRAGYRENSAGEMGYENLSKPQIIEAIHRTQKERSDKTKINAEWVLKRAALLADFNIKTFITVRADGQAIYDFSQATDADWYCISEYTVDVITKGGGRDQYEVDRVKLKSFDKLRALELVGKHVNVQAFRDRITVDGSIGITIDDKDDEL